MKFTPEYLPGATPLDPNEIDGLIPDINNQGELNTMEQQNILIGKNWCLKYKKEILDEIFVRKLHKKMYGDVWKWAGTYRITDKSIGIDKNQISTRVVELMRNTQTWIEFESYPWREILSRFHHQLVFIHPFPNGNGRYARLHTELLAEKYNQLIPTWGARTKKDRAEYISALKKADNKQFDRLIKFIDS
ncbi:MAG: mobile mystery protein B [Bdellovibrionota bacterium]